MVRRKIGDGAPDFWVMERRWLSLARSYEFTQRLSDFSNETKRQTDKLPKP